MRALSNSVSIIGVGARTAVGLTAASTAAAVRAGIAGMAHHAFMVDKAGAPMVVCADPELPVNVRGAGRLVDLAIGAARQALLPLREKGRSSFRVSVFIALPEPRPGLSPDLEAAFSNHLESALKADIHIDRWRCSSTGHAGGILCMEEALSSCTAGVTDFCLIGGVESYLEPETLEWLDDQDQLHSETTIWGFCPAEAAAFVLLATAPAIQSLGLFAPVELISVASATEPNRIKTETVCIGEGLSQAFKKTLGDLSHNILVDHTICDMNGEPYRGNEYGFAMLRSNRWFRDDSDFETPADCWGDVGAASGPLFAVLAWFAAVKGYAPGPSTLVWASSEGGVRAAALMHGMVEQ